MMLLAFNTPYFDYLAKILTSLACKTNGAVAGLLQLIEAIMHIYLVSQLLKSECSIQAINIFLLHGSTTVTCRNTLLNDSDDQCFILQTCFHCKF